VKQTVVKKSIFYQLSCIAAWYWTRYNASTSWWKGVLNDGINTDLEKIFLLHLCIKWYFMPEEHKTFEREPD